MWYLAAIELVVRITYCSQVMAPRLPCPRCNTCWLTNGGTYLHCSRIGHLLIRLIVLTDDKSSNIVLGERREIRRLELGIVATIPSLDAQISSLGVAQIEVKSRRHSFVVFSKEEEAASAYVVLNKKEQVEPSF